MVPHVFAEGPSFAPPDDDSPPSPWEQPAPIPAGKTPGPRSTKALPIVGGFWVSQGPGPSLYGQSEGVVPDNRVVGAIHTVIPHPTNADILYIGAVNGGIWKTTDATSANPAWTALADTAFSLSIGAMDLDPTDATHNTLVAGIGRYSSWYQAGGSLGGLLRTTDGGANWTPITPVILSGESCSGIAARGNTMMFASGRFFGAGGLYRTTNGGANWTQIAGGVSTGLPAGGLHDLVGDPSDPSLFYCTVSATGVYRSTDTGATWTAISDATQTTIFGTGYNNNAELAVQPVTGRLYVAILRSGRADYIGYTDSAAAPTPTWVRMDLPTMPVVGTSVAVTNATNASPIQITAAAHGFSGGQFVEITGVTGNTAANGIFRIASIDANNFTLDYSTGNGSYTGGGAATATDGLNPGNDKPGAQGNLHFSLLADPISANLIYVAGDRQDAPFPNYIMAYNYSGSLWRGNTAIAATGSSPSPQWAHLTHSNAIVGIPGGGTAGGSAPHADSREMAFDANGDLIETDDGGIYRRTSPQNNTGDWYSIIGDLRVTEQHDIAYDTVSNVIISGNQDTGTTQQQTSGSTTWNSVSTGDGGDVAVDTVSAAPNSIRYSSFQYLGAFVRRTYDSSNGLVSTVYPAGSGSGAFEASFASPVEVNAVTPTRIVAGGDNGILESFDRGDTVTYLVTSSINRDCLAYGANGNADVLYAASANTVLVRLSGTGAPVATAVAYPGATVTDLAVDSNNESIVYVCDLSGSVYMNSAGGAAAWTNLTGTLSGETTELRAIEYISSAPYGLVAGGNGGAFIMELSSPGTWNQLGSGLSSAVVWDLDYDPVDDVLVAGTLGRGAWKLLSPPVPVGLSAFKTD